MTVFLVSPYYTFSKYLSAWGTVLLNDDHKTKHRSQMISKDGMKVLLATILLRISDVVRRKQAQKSHWVTDWLKLFVIFQKKI